MQPTAEQMGLWHLAAGEMPDEGLVQGTGCEACLQTGYRERMVLFELLTVSEVIREQTLQRAKASTIKAEVLRGGMVTLRRDGLAKAAGGRTSLEEVARVTARDEF